MSSDRYARSRELAATAAGSIAGVHHLSGRPLVPDQPPLYLEHGAGARVRDVDGNVYLDFVLSYGAVVLGHADAEVDEAARAQLARGSLLSLNHRMHVAFADRLLRWFPTAERVMFMKTGSEATTAALRIARRATGRRMVVRCGYHGWHDWCLPLEPWVPATLDAQVLEFDANHPETLAEILARDGERIAAVILAPEMLRPLGRETLAEIAGLTRRAGALFVLDEVKTAFRTAPGSVQQRLGVVPDLTTVSKALGNGWPIAAVLGGRDVMDHARGMHCSATYHGDAAAMAAAIATLDAIERRGVLDQLWARGESLLAGLTAAIERHGLPAEAFAEPLPPMPMLRFTAAEVDRSAALGHAFFSAMMERGVLLHPRHLWFVCAAHTERDIAEVVGHADEVMARLARAP